MSCGDFKNCQCCMSLSLTMALQAFVSITAPWEYCGPHTSSDVFLIVLPFIMKLSIIAKCMYLKILCDNLGVTEAVCDSATCIFKAVLSHVSPIYYQSAV